jgi:hypothetical protein
MKKIFLILSIFIFLASANMSFSYIKVYRSTIDVTDRGDGRPVFGAMYETVRIECIPDQCILYCYTPGTSYECSFKGATWCEGCEENRIIYVNEDGDEFFEHAQDQITLGQLVGTYTNNIYREPLGLTIYRSVTWSVDMITLVATIEITISDGQN